MTSGFVAHDWVPAWVRGTIPAQLMSMKNQRQAFRAGGKPNGRLIFAKKPEALAFEAVAIPSIAAAAKARLPRGPIDGPVCLTVRATYRHERSDLDIALLMDCLAKGGAIVNDKQVVEQHAYKLVDKNGPKVEWEVRSLSGQS